MIVSLYKYFFNLSLHPIIHKSWKWRWNCRKLPRLMQTMFRYWWGYTRGIFERGNLSFHLFHIVALYIWNAVTDVTPLLPQARKTFTPHLLVSCRRTSSVDRRHWSANGLQAERWHEALSSPAKARRNGVATSVRKTTSSSSTSWPMRRGREGRWKTLQTRRYSFLTKRRVSFVDINTLSHRVIRPVLCSFLVILRRRNSSSMTRKE